MHFWFFSSSTLSERKRRPRGEGLTCRGQGKGRKGKGPAGGGAAMRPPDAAAASEEPEKQGAVRNLQVANFANFLHFFFVSGAGG